MFVYLVFLLLVVLATRADEGERLLCLGNKFCGNQPDGTVLPDPDDCRNYYVCFLRHDCQRSCPLFQHFDHIRLNCLPRSLAICYDSAATTTTSESPQTTFTPPDTEEPTTELTTTTPTTTEQTTTETTDQPITCDSGFTGRLPHPNDCTKYYACYADQEEPVLKDCLPGYIFYVPFAVCLPGNSETCELHGTLAIH